MTLIRFEPNFPAEILEPVGAIIERHKHLIPDWCRSLRMFYSLGGNNGDVNCAASVEYNYRWAHIYVYAGWLNTDEREHDLIHELFHIVTAPIADNIKKQLKISLQNVDSAHRDVVLEMHKNAVESMVEDLTNLYLAGRLDFPGQNKI